MTTTVEGSIEPKPRPEDRQVTVQMSGFVDDFCPMYYDVLNEDVCISFGKGRAEDLSVTFTDQALLNLALLVNEAVCATLRARGIPIPAYVGQPRINE